MIIYFSATGNSEYVAKSIASLCDDEIINMTDYLKNNSVLDKTSEKPYVIVCPVYISTIPVIISNLLKKSKLSGNKNIYFIMTCAGSGISAASMDALKIANTLKLDYKGIEHISMPQDYLMFFTVQDSTTNELKLKEAFKKIPSLAATINSNQDFNKNKVGFFHKLSIKPVIWLFDKFFIKPKKFYTTDECVACGLCQKVCPLNNIKLVDNKPIWDKNCIHCSACINRCPKKAIEYGKKTIGKNRYIAPKFID